MSQLITIKLKLKMKNNFQSQLLIVIFIVQIYTKSAPDGFQEFNFEMHVYANQSEKIVSL